MFCFLFCVFCVLVLCCLSFLPVYKVLYLLFVYNFNDHSGNPIAVNKYQYHTTTLQHTRVCVCVCVRGWGRPSYSISLPDLLLLHISSKPVNTIATVPCDILCSSRLISSDRWHSIVKQSINLRYIGLSRSHHEEATNMLKELQLPLHFGLLAANGHWFAEVDY
jgi:hypothetical protein